MSENQKKYTYNYTSLNKETLDQIAFHTPKIKNQKDYIQLKEDENYNKIISPIIYFGYYVTVKGTGNWLGANSCILDYLGILGHDGTFELFDKCLKIIQKHKITDFKITVYLTHKDREHISNPLVIKQDVIDKLYRYYDIKFNENDIDVKLK